MYVTTLDVRYSVNSGAGSNLKVEGHKFLTVPPCPIVPPY